MLEFKLKGQFILMLIWLVAFAVMNRFIPEGTLFQIKCCIIGFSFNSLMLWIK